MSKLLILFLCLIAVKPSNALPHNTGPRQLTRPQRYLVRSEGAEINAASRFDSMPDPQCSRGVPTTNRKLCCAPGCPQCGGRGCAKNPPGRACCSWFIWRSKRYCPHTGPPCMLIVPWRYSASPSPSPSTAATASSTSSPSPMASASPTSTPMASASPSSATKASASPTSTPTTSVSPTPVATASTSPTSAATSDPTCATGTKDGVACCHGDCSICGGKNCGKRYPGNGACCSNRITRSCANNLPPCRIYPSPSPSPSVGSSRWETVKKLAGKPVKRHEACFVWVNGKGYLVGGRRVNPTSIFDPVAKTWTDGAKPPIQIHHMQCVGYEGKVWVASSFTGGFPREKNTKNMYVYDTVTDSWDALEGLPEPRRRGGGASVLHDDKIYVVAGNRGGHGAHSTALGWMDYYDLKLKKWVTDLPSMPSPRDHVGGAMVGNRLCIAAGRDSGVKAFFEAIVTSTWCYNFDTQMWVNTGADIPQGRAGAATETTCEGEMMVAGGETNQRKAWDRVDLFDGVRWKRTADMQRGRHGSGLGVSNCTTCGKIFIASGSGNRGGSPELESAEVYLKDGVNYPCSSY